MSREMRREMSPILGAAVFVCAKILSAQKPEASLPPIPRLDSCPGLLDV